MGRYLMFLPKTEEEKIFLNKIYSEIKKDLWGHQINCLVIDRNNKMYGVSLPFFHVMRGSEEYGTRDITYKEIRLLAFKHTIGEITLY